MDYKQSVQDYLRISILTFLEYTLASSILYVYMSYTPWHSRFQQGLKTPIQNVTCPSFMCLHSLHPVTHILKSPEQKKIETGRASCDVAGFVLDLDS